MNTIRSIISWLLPVAILVAATAIFFWMGSQAPPERKKDDLPTAMPVKTTAVEKAVGKTEIDTDGVVVPLREVTLAAEVAGRITQKTANCRAGRFVKAGTELFEIDRRDYELDVARLEGELRQAAIYIQEIDEELAQNVESTHLAEQQVALARRDVKRLDGLRADRIITESEHDKALREELTVMNSLSSLQGQKRVLSKRRSRLVEAQSLAATLLERADKGLGTRIGEGGVKVSGGEKQRLSIARSLLRQPDLMVFDEATSSLDSITEEEVSATIREVAERREAISILIAHRLSTVMHADRIYVLERGRIVEQGSHGELLGRKGLYYAMWRQQVGEPTVV